MARTKKKTFKVTYAPVDKESWIVKGYSTYDMRRSRRRFRAYTDVQALALANLNVPVSIAYSQNHITSKVTIQYKVEKIVEIIERPVEI